jgi:hypothetical protein
MDFRFYKKGADMKTSPPTGLTRIKKVPKAGSDLVFKPLLGYCYLSSEGKLAADYQAKAKNVLCLIQLNQKKPLRNQSERLLRLIKS